MLVSPKILWFLALGFLPSTLLAIPMPSQEEMWKMLQAQQQEIQELKKQLKKTDEKAEAAVEVADSHTSTNTADGAPGWWKNTQLGGYGELHYNGGDKDRVDFHRFVVMVNHQFNDDIRLYSEVELEHSLSGDDEPGEVELEQAFIEFNLNESLRAKTGLFLVPVGMLNERHEPTTFFGVERNPIESNIIPTTWWEAGAALSGEFADQFQYDIALHSGLETPIEGDSAFNIRSGRQKVANATAKDGAVTGRINWNGVSGVSVGGSVQYQNDITQSSLSEDISALLLSTHTDIRKGPVGFRAMYAHWDLDGDAPSLVGRDTQDGWFVEPSYFFDTDAGEIGLFGRYNRYDNQGGSSMDTEYEQFDVGLNFWPHPNVVLKADMAFVNAPSSGNDDEILNLGVGFHY
ncbi:MAG: hypothetical protein KDD55_08235 [Bdellovibrionales bacterium]|nr:hypothetical protein [Bdellovibrionales bacterium]